MTMQEELAKYGVIRVQDKGLFAFLDGPGHMIRGYVTEFMQRTRAGKIVRHSNIVMEHVLHFNKHDVTTRFKYDLASVVAVWNSQ